MIDASPDGVLLVDASGMIVFANAMITSMFGFSPTDTAIGEHVDNLLPDDVRDAHAVLRADFQTDPHTRTMGIGLALLARRRDGSVFPVEVSLSPIYDRDGYATIATVRDISDRVTLEASAQRDRNALAAAQERARMQRSLHDTVIQRLFATGLGLHAITQAMLASPLRDTLEEIVDQLDLTVQEIRATIAGHALADTTIATALQLTDAINAWTAPLGYAPTTAMIGDIESVPAHIIPELVPTLTEALSNVAHHAHATSVRVTIRRSTNSVVVEVTDNGIGIDPAANPNGHGLNNLRHRAERLGGTAQFIRNDHGGTTLIWHVPT